MRIGVDVRSLLSPTGRGVSHYVQAVLAELIRRHPADTWILFSTGRRLVRLPKELARRNVVHRHVDAPNKLMNLVLATRQVPIERFTGPLDVFFAPNFGFVSLTPATPLVVTVHDLSFELFPKFFSFRERLWHRLVKPRQLLARAGRIIAVSAQTSAELRSRYRIAPGRIQVIHSGIDPAYRRRIPTAERRRVRRKYRLPARYFLYLGAVEPRKNLPTLLNGFKKARAQGSQAGLVVAGAIRGRPKVPDGVRLLGYVPEADKPALYAEAVAVVLPSRHEGFGFPPLEALAAGTPSVVSDLPVFKETVGPAAVTIKADDAAALAENLVHLERDETFRKRLVKRGQRRVAAFDWGKTADATYRVLRKVSR